jgi:hypothetical protein
MGEMRDAPVLGLPQDTPDDEVIGVASLKTIY